MALCSRCTYPSIHFFVSRSRSVVDCAHVRAFTMKLSRSWSVVRGAVVCDVLCVVWVHEGVVLCDVLCVVLFGVLRGGGVVLLCWCFISLFLSFSLSLNSLLSLSRSPSFFLVLSFFCPVFLFLFSLLPLSLLSSLLANKHCVKH